MALRLKFELRLEERCPDRVFVSVLLAPERKNGTTLEGVCLQLTSRTGEPLSPQMVLPIAGRLRQPMLSTVELRAGGEIPQGSRVVGTVWNGCEQREEVLPTDPFTELEAHVRGRRAIAAPSRGEVLERLVPEERRRIASFFPWVDEPRLPPEPVGQLEVVDDEESEEAYLDDMCDGMGLDEESAEWLKDLLAEDL